MQLVGEVSKYDQEIAAAPLQRTVERTARDWDQLIRHKIAIQILAVSFYCNTENHTNAISNPTLIHIIIDQIKLEGPVQVVCQQLHSYL